MRVFVFASILSIPCVALAQEKLNYLSGAYPLSNGQVVFTRTLTMPRTGCPCGFNVKYQFILTTYSRSIGSFAVAFNVNDGRSNFAKAEATVTAPAPSRAPYTRVSDNEPLSFKKIRL